MNALSCARTRLRLQQRAAGLSASEALRLEEHLAGCDECRAQASALDQLCAIAREYEPVLPPNARKRAINAALAMASTMHASERPPRGRALAWSVAAVVLLTVVVIGSWPHRSDDPKLATVPPSKATATGTAMQLVAGDRVLSGTIEAGGRPLARATAIASGEELFCVADATLALAHANVTLAPQTRVRWQASTNQLELIAGRARIEVDPAKHRAFSVKTPRFTVHVLGTRFEVDLEGVRVERGVVRVVGTDGTVLAADLKAGEHFALAATATERAEAEAQTEIEADASEREPNARGDAARRLLRHARESLAARDAPAARGEISAALAMHPAQALRAEAMTLRAECALVETDVEGAIRAYLQVARAFSRLPAAQNALFAAARLQAERGRSREAAKLFSQYVERYPAGALIEDAHRRLQALNGSARSR